MSRRVLALLALLAAGCQVRDVGPPHAQFLVVAGDSTYWVSSTPQGVRVRGSPIQLARYGGRFYEVFIVDDDRSYTNAEIVGQQVWRRDLMNGDSAVVFEDTTVAGLERWYARTHPDDAPLDTDEDLPAHPPVSATSEFDILDEFGPYLAYEYHADLTVTAGGGHDEWHAARHGVLDLRTGKDVTIADLFGDRTASYVVHRGAELFTQTLDSVLASGDARAKAAASAMGDFQFDSSSWSITAVDGAPAIAFAVPGRGSRAAGVTLPLPPIRVGSPAWWDDARRGLPTGADSSTLRWHHGSFTVIAREVGDGTAARLSLVDSARREWPGSLVQTPVSRIYWLDPPGVDSAVLRSLSRAFDEAALYSDEARTAVAHPRPPRPGVLHLTSTLHPWHPPHRLPRHRASPRRSSPT